MTPTIMLGMRIIKSFPASTEGSGVVAGVIDINIIHVIEFSSL